MNHVTFIGLPLYTLSKNHGMGKGVKVFREAGITQALQKNAESFLDNGDVPLSEIHSDSGPKNLRNFAQFLQDTEAIQRAIGKVDAGDLVFFLGGECSIVVGTLAGFRSKIKGKPGVVWIDAHGDFNTAETTPSGFIGGMCLALACGRGPKLNATIESSEPLITEENVVHMASRALDPMESDAMSSSPMKIYSAATLRKDGITLTADLAAQSLSERCDWIICHLDADSLDPGIMPAVNYPEQGGLTLEEVKAIVGATQRTGKLKVLELAGYNSILDQNQTCVTKMIKLSSEIFSYKDKHS
jgi:arginase